MAAACPSGKVRTRRTSTELAVKLRTTPLRVNTIASFSPQTGPTALGLGEGTVGPDEAQKHGPKDLTQGRGCFFLSMTSHTHIEPSRAARAGRRAAATLTEQEQILISIVAFAVLMNKWRLNLAGNRMRMRPTRHHAELHSNCRSSYLHRCHVTTTRQSASPASMPGSSVMYPLGSLPIVLATERSHLDWLVRTVPQQPHFGFVC